MTWSIFHFSSIIFYAFIRAEFSPFMCELFVTYWTCFNNTFPMSYSIVKYFNFLLPENCIKCRQTFFRLLKLLSLYETISKPGVIAYATGLSGLMRGISITASYAVCLNRVVRYSTNIIRFTFLD